MEDLIGAEILEVPELEPRLGPNTGDEVPEDIQGQLQSLAREAEQFFQENLEPDMTEATDYYYGRPFGNEKDGSSKFVSTDLRDVTMSQLPDLLRIFFGPEKVAKFNPTGEEDVKLAEEMTEAISYTVRHQENAFLEFHSWMKDALVRRLGWVTWWWEGDEVETETLVLSMPEFAMFMEQINAPEGAAMQYQLVDIQEAGMPGFVEVTVEYRSQIGSPKFAAVPPEEVFWTPGARGMDDVDVLVWKREMTVAKLEKMGYDRSEFEDQIGPARDSNGQLKFARQVGSGRAREASYSSHLGQSGPVATQPVVFSEVFMLVDGEEGAEFRRFECVGDEFIILNGEGEVVNDIPFAYLTPEPEPHTIVGLSNWDLQKDVQLVKSQLQREMLNSLARSVDERIEVVANEVSIEDLMNPMASKFIRVRRPGMMRELNHTFQGANILPVLAFYDQVKEERGVPKASAGLDPDALQSSTRAGVVATIQGARAKVEMIARIFAETGYRRLFKGLAEMIKDHGGPMTMRLMNGPTQINPLNWNLDMDVEVEVALGVADKDTQLAHLGRIIEGQLGLMQSGHPAVGFANIRHAFAKSVEVAGFKDSSSFIAPFGPEQEQQYRQQQAEAAENQQGPEEMLFMIEQAKQEIEREKNTLKSRELDLKEEQMRVDAELKRDEMVIKAALEREKLAVQDITPAAEDVRGETS